MDKAKIFRYKESGASRLFKMQVQITLYSKIQVQMLLKTVQL